jgi:Uma2 family endonuclease
MTTVSPTLQALQEPAPFRFSRDAYYQMAEIGLFRNCRVELLEGVIYEMSPQREIHAATIGLVAAALQRAFPSDWVRQQLPLNFGVRSDPEPDLAVVRGRPRDYVHRDHHPTEALLIVEVAESSLSYDRRKKAAVYAAARIPDYWLVNLVDGVLEVRRDPAGSSDDPTNLVYQTVLTLDHKDTVSPLAAPAAQIPVADLLP